MPVEQLLRARMVGILGAGAPPALPDLVARRLQHFSLVVFSHCTRSSMMRKSRWRSFSCAFSVGNRSGCAEGSSTICAKMTARPPPAAAAPTSSAVSAGALGEGSPSRRAGSLD